MDYCLHKTRSFHLHEALLGKTVSRSCVAPLTVMPLMYLLKLSKIKSWLVLPDSCKVLAGKKAGSWLPEVVRIALWLM
jgi:hypothetical protein